MKGSEKKFDKIVLTEKKFDIVVLTEKDNEVKSLATGKIKNN